MHLPSSRSTTRGYLAASPPLILALGFLGIICVGALLFKMPWASATGLSWFEAFFTATSAVTVSGLMIIEPATQLSLLGQLILSVLVQIGGLGFVTFAVLAFMSLGKRISMHQQVVALEAFNQTNVSHIRQTAFVVFKLAFGLQLIAIVGLSAWWYGQGLSGWRAIYMAYFHVSMAFNNAGIALYDQSLIHFIHDPLVLLTLSVMVMAGGIGFQVLIEVLRKKRWSLFSPYSRVILGLTLILNVVGFIILWAFEFNNPFTIGLLPWYEQAAASWMQVIASRTAGFVTMEPGAMQDSTVLLLMFYMFIGGGSLSTASGIKLGTFAVLLAAVFSYLRQRQEVVLLQRTVPTESILKALALVFVTLSLFFSGVLLISMFDQVPFKSMVFEVMSAITTTGMSFGLTPHLSKPSQLVLMVLMFAGRLGPLTLVYILATRQHSRIRYAEGSFHVG